MTNTSVRGVDRPTRGSRTHPATMQFANAEEAWLWTMGCLLARQQGARFGANKGLVRRPCEPDDVEGGDGTAAVATSCERDHRLSARRPSLFRRVILGAACLGPPFAPL
jgi:hypothetical protein